MQKYRAFVHYHFKKGMEEKGIQFLENELIKKASHYGCHGLELWQDGRDPTFVIGIGDWNNLEEAKRFQSLWSAKEHELLRFCTDSPRREFCKIRDTYSEKGKKVA